MGVRVGTRPAKDKKPGWWVFINHKGKRTKKCFGTNKKLAQEFAAKLTAKLKWAEVNGEPVALSQPDQVMPTVKAYLTDWLSSYAEVHCKRTTAEGYRRSVDQHIFPVLGTRQLHEVTRADIKRVIADLAGKKLKKQTIHNVLTPLKEAYNHAIDDGLVGTNPVARTGRFTRSNEDRRLHVKPLTAEEVRALLRTAADKAPTICPLLLCAVRTGLRQGELIGLQWGDVDFRGEFIEVRRAIVRGRLTSTKNHKIRRVDMTPQLAQALHSLYETRCLEAGMDGKTVPEWVFITPSWTRWDDSNLRRAFHWCLGKAEIRRVRFHDLRHTYASLMGEAGAPPKYVQEQLGHSSIQVTMDIYSHLFPGGNREWVKRLDDPLGEGKPAPQAHPSLVAPAGHAA